MSARWQEWEDAAIQDEYLTAGADVLAERLPRTANAIRNRAQYLDACVSTKAPEPAVVVPAHDYTDDDRAWQSARLPVFNRGLLTWRFA